MRKLGLPVLAFLLPVLGWAQAAAPAAPEEAAYTPYRDPVFYGLLIVAVVLLIFILMLQRLFTTVARNYSRGERGGFGRMLQAVALLLAFSSLPQFAAAADGEQASFLKHGFGSNAVNALFFLIIVEIAVVLYYVRLLTRFLGTDEVEETAVSVEAAPAKPSFWERFNASVAVEKEATILTEHDYDGIRELDNSLPPWWKYGFYFTIVWAVAYLIHYHVTRTGPLQLAEYENQLEQAEVELAAFRAKSQNQVDETTVTLLTDASAIAKGKVTFESLCAACHGLQGQGIIGPNMTDAYWKHGGSIGDIFKTIKLGVPATGMKAWKEDLSPMQMAEVSSYILTLQGTNPPNPKAPEGELYTPASAAPADSTGAAAAPAPDSTTVATQ